MQELMSTLPIHLSFTMPSNDHETTFKSSGSKAILIELYSAAAEGCSSCSPAEAWITAFKTSSELWKSIFPVVFHVDYSSDHGRPDPYAKRAYAERQRIAHLKRNSAYCPEFITSGREWLGWLHGEQYLPPTIETIGELSIRVNDDGTNILAIYTSASLGEAKDHTINVALLGVNVSSDGQCGEDGARQFQHEFVALDFAAHPMTKPEAFGSGLARFKLSTDEPATAIVAWVSAANGSIVQVTGGWLKSSDAGATLSTKWNDTTQAVPLR
jgi:hypothetical protein